MRRLARCWWFAAVALMASSCGVEPSRTTAAQDFRHEGLHGTLWVQTSAEYRGAVEQAYRLARHMLDRGLEDPTWTAALEQEGEFSHLPPAVILDIDETVLDNSPFQGQLIKDDAEFESERWSRWIELRQAEALPGALEFITYARSKEVEVFYVTNRNDEHEAATRDNLEKLGFPFAENRDALLTRGEEPDWGSDKASRRAFVAQEFRVLLLVGDDFNDFVSGAREGAPEERVELASRYRDYWGDKWIVLPNPLYGSWEGALYSFQYNLTAKEKRRRKFDRLVTPRLEQDQSFHEGGDEMTGPDQMDELAALFTETGEAHHEAFIETDGEDPEWPLWYANYLAGKLGQLLDADFTKSELVYLLVLASKEQQLLAPGSQWPVYYTNFFLDRY